jgi:hypothetical protein
MGTGDCAMFVSLTTTSRECDTIPGFPVAIASKPGRFFLCPVFRLGVGYLQPFRQPPIAHPKETMMQPRAMTSMLLALALGCSGQETSPTDLRPQFAGGCTNTPIITANPASISVTAGSSSQSSFSVKNGCASLSGPWDIGATSSGSVVLTGGPSPSSVTLKVGQTITVTVPFTAGAAGSGTVVLKASMDHDPPPPLTSSGTQNVTVTGGASGVSFGPADLFNASGGLRQVAPFTWTMDIVDPAGIAAQISTAHNNHIKLVLVMTGGGSSNYTTAGKFDYTRWVNKQNTFNTTAIKQAVANGVADGTIPFAMLIDEPNRSDWGGNVHHTTLDSMSRYTKSIFPTLRTGVDVTYTWESTSIYTSVDVITTQFAGTDKSGDTTAYRTQAVSSANAQNVALFFSINILNGGKKLMSTGCPMPQTGGSGSTESGVLVGCKMTAAEVQAYGDALLKAPETCGLKMWTWDLTTLTPTGDFMTRADNQAAFNHLAGTAAAHPAKPCVKPH